MAKVDKYGITIPDESPQNNEAPDKADLIKSLQDKLLRRTALLNGDISEPAMSNITSNQSTPSNMARQNTTYSNMETKIKEYEDSLKYAVRQSRNPQLTEEQRKDYQSKLPVFIAEHKRLTDEFNLVNSEMDRMKRERVLHNPIIETAIGGVKGLGSGISLGISDLLAKKLLSEETYNNLQPTTTPGKIAETTGDIGGSILTAAGLSKYLAKIPLVNKIAHQFDKAVALRGGTALTMSLARNGTSWLKGEQSLPDALKNTGINVVASWIGMVPENLIKAGIVNMMGQIGTSGAFDILADLAQGKADFNDLNYWKTKGVNLATPAIFALKDYANKVGATPGVGARTWKKTQQLGYGNMLAGIGTQFQNIVEAPVNQYVRDPLTKLIHGSMDWLGSKIQPSKPQTAFPSEAFSYFTRKDTKLFQDFPLAIKEFGKGWSGKSDMQSRMDIPEVDSIYQSAIGKGFEKVVKLPMNFLQSFDAFNTKLGYEAQLRSLSKREDISKTTIPDKEKRALQASQYNQYNLPLNEGDRKAMPWLIAHLAQKVMNARESKIPIIKGTADVFLPFVKVMANRLTQIGEFSPIGLVSNPRSEAFAKGVVGTIPWIIGGIYASSGESDKDGINIDSEHKLGWNNIPTYLSFPGRAMAVFYEKLRDRRLNESALENMIFAGMKIVPLYLRESNMRDLKNFLNFLEFTPGAVSETVGNVASRFIPAAGLLRTINKATDPYLRKVDPNNPFLRDKQFQYATSQIPFLSSQIPAKMDEETGVTNRNTYPILRALGLNLDKRNLTQETNVREDKYDRQESRANRDYEKMVEWLTNNNMSPTIADIKLDKWFDWFTNRQDIGNVERKTSKKPKVDKYGITIP